MLKVFPRLAVLMALGAAFPGCTQKPNPPPASAKPAVVAGDPEWTQFAHRIIEDYFVLDPFFAVNAGRHEFDGRMPDLSAGGIQHEVTWLKRVREIE